MTNKFIKLNSKFTHHVNPIFIVSLEEDLDNKGTTVHTMDGKCFFVKETVAEILKLIKISETFTINS